MADREDPARDVLTSLPRSRPARRSPKRAARAAPAAPAAGPAGSPAAGRPARERAGRSEAPGDGPPGPRRKVPPAGYAAPRPRADDVPAADPAELVATAIQGVAELAQIALAIGRQTLRGVLERLPRP